MFDVFDFCRVFLLLDQVIKFYCKGVNKVHLSKDQSTARYSIAKQECVPSVLATQPISIRYINTNSYANSEYSAKGIMHNYRAPEWYVS